MQRSYTRTILLISLIPLLLALLSISALAKAKPVKATVVKLGQPAPSFTVRTLEGVTYNNASLGGSPALLQFWTARCRDCRDDQAALDEIDSKFAGQGLVVLAINEGDSAKTVNKFLREHPRTVRIVLDERQQIARRFGKHGVPSAPVVGRLGWKQSYPYYVLIDRQGRIAGTQHGAAGQQGLLSLLKRAGLQDRQPAQARSVTSKAKVLDVAQDTTPRVEKSTKKGATPEATKDEQQGAADQKQPGQKEPGQKQAGEGKQATDKEQAAGGKPGEQATAPEEPPKPSGMKVIDIPPDKSSHPGQPLPKAVFVLTSGERLEADRYTMDTKYLHVAMEGEERIIPISAVDVQATESANRARGLDLKIPTSKSEVFVSF